ncbi:MAG: uroporphyrinogen-III synthase [Nitrospiraceae bacterium]|nr:uroporphyrinogen-III synthase [Nitrospiraceae bacterium]
MSDTGFNGLTVAAFENRMAAEMTGLIERYGGRPMVTPAMREVPLEDNREALQFGERLLADQVDVLILMTGVGLETLIGVLKTRHPLESITEALRRITLVARGPKPVAVLKQLGLTPTFTVPEPNTWRDLLRTLDTNSPVLGLRVALQEYGASNAELLEELRERGATLFRVPVYRWALPEILDQLREALGNILAGQVDVLLITNAVQVDHVMQMLANDGGVEQFKQAVTRMVVASVGPTASERLRHYGWPVDVEPSHPKMGTLVKETAERAAALLRQKR